MTIVQGLGLVLITWAIIILIGHYVSVWWKKNKRGWKVVYANTDGAWSDGWFTKEEAIKEMFNSDQAYAITKKRGFRQRAIDGQNFRVRKVKNHFIYEEK